MNAWEAALLGFIQGATEFLPVSSSGHLVIGQSLLDIQISGVHFEVAVHVATLLSVLIVYRERLATLVKGAASGDRDAWRYIGMLAIGTVPAAAVGLGLSGFIESMFEVPQVTGVALIGTGVILWSSKVPLARDLKGSPGLRDVILIGLAQALALIPGVSRSGTTVVAALWLGVEAKEAAAFSFLLAIPAISGAAILKLPDLMETGAIGITTTALIVGGLLAAITGILAIKTFLMLLAKKGFHSFGVYCAIAGLSFLTFLFLTG